jgi:hypothetical protein
MILNSKLNINKKFLIFVSIKITIQLLKQNKSNNKIFCYVMKLLF